MSYKVLFISSWYPNPKDKTHGIFVKRYAEAAAMFNDVAVIHVFGDESFSDTIRVESKTENKVKEIYVFYKKRKLHRLSKFKLYRNLYSIGLNTLLNEWGRPDLVQVNIVFPVAVAAIPLIKKLNIPYLISEHWTGYHPEDGAYKGFLMRYFTKRLFRDASAVVSVTSHLKKSMMMRGLQGNYHVIPNVVNENIFYFKEILRENKFRFLHVSSLDQRQKNVEGIIRVFKEFLITVSDSELLIVGNGEHKLQLENLAGEFLNKSIYFTGNKFGSELAELYNSADCFVLFSNYENLPVVLLEAQCCGLPVVTTDVGGIKEFMDDESVEFVKAQDQNSLLNAMKKIHRDFSKFDRRKISTKALEKFSYQTIGKHFTKIYKSILD